MWLLAAAAAAMSSRQQLLLVSSLLLPWSEEEISKTSKKYLIFLVHGARTRLRVVLYSM
jgi:hypothetical protein